MRWIWWMAALAVTAAIPAALEAAADAPRPLVFGVNRVGGSGVLGDPPGYDEDLYRRILEAGGTCVRILASPRDIEKVRGKRDWSDFDRDLELARRYGQEPVVLIVNTPAWASPTGEATHLYPYKAELLGEFAGFCEDLARRTLGKARLFQLWNEPNGCGWHFHDGFNHADEYLPVLRACREALKKGNPACLLSLGGLDDAEGHAPIFLRKTFEEKKARGIGGSLFEAVSDHPYSESVPVMRGKLDALREILRSNGEGDRPFWITEYGWHTGAMKPADQAKRVAEFLEAFASSAWSDLQAAIYLSIADFEMGTEGFGLCDANLRPRPSFFAFQGASRFGAYPPHSIEPVFTARGRLELRWKTLEPTTGLATLDPGAREARSPLGTDHRVQFDGLEPGSSHSFAIETTRGQGSGAKSIRSAAYEVRTPGPEIQNGDFEEGFFGGIGKGWDIRGAGFCTDSALLPFSAAGKGRRAQAIFARGDLGHEKIESTISAVVLAEPGKPIEISYSWAAEDLKTLSEIAARAGIDPTGGADPGSPRILWTGWKEPKRSWEKGSVRATAGNSLVRLYIQCRTEGPLRKGTAVFLLDDVRSFSPATPAEK